MLGAEKMSKANENGKETGTIVFDSSRFLMHELAQFVKGYGWEDYTILVKFRGREINRGVEIKNIKMQRDTEVEPDIKVGLTD